MDTTAIKARKAESSDISHIKTNHKGITKLLVSIPVELRAGLAEMSAETGTPQQELIRQAIRNLLAADGFGGLEPKPTKPVHQVALGISVVKTEPQAKTQVQPTTDSRPAQPSPDHTWVVRGSGGYWRARKGSSK